MNHQPQEHNSVPNFWSTRYAITIRDWWCGSLFSLNRAFTMSLVFYPFYSF